jgi:hypothetical protein
MLLSITKRTQPMSQAKTLHIFVSPACVKLLEVEHVSFVGGISPRDVVLLRNLQRDFLALAPTLSAHTYKS